MEVAFIVDSQPHRTVLVIVGRDRLLGREGDFDEIGCVILPAFFVFLDEMCVFVEKLAIETVKSGVNFFDGFLLFGG